jgi:2-polyprenyl-6-methoxyphenol hydroxylase-like FAD-dependent oxidoreductase
VNIPHGNENRGGATGIDRDGILRSAPLSHPPPQVTERPGWKRRLIDFFSVDTSPAVEIIRATEGSLVGTNQYDMPHVPTWRRGRMVIIGDAAHAAAPASGQGASMAVEDAVVLAKTFRETPSIPSALATYEAVRLPRVERVVEYGARFGGAKAPGPVSRIIRDLMLPFIFKRAASPKSMRSTSWLFDYHIGWDEPLHAAAREEAGGS